jgi:hypothetical protein
MNPHTIRRLFPNASKSIIAANAQDYGQAHIDTRLQATKPVKLAPALAVKGSGEASGARLPHCCITQCRVKLLDVDAKWSAVKDLLDALVACGALPGDRENQITLEVRQIRVAHFKEEKTIVEIDSTCSPIESQ